MPPAGSQTNGLTAIGRGVHAVERTSERTKAGQGRGELEVRFGAPISFHFTSASLREKLAFLRLLPKAESLVCDVLRVHVSRDKYNDSPSVRPPWPANHPSKT